jgi:hypothetical protein
MMAVSVASGCSLSAAQAVEREIFRVRAAWVTEVPSLISWRSAAISAGPVGAQDARVQRWIEDSGNAALMGRQLPPAEVLAADQRITFWAKQLRKAGLEGDMDQLRARPYLDILLNTAGPARRNRNRPYPERRPRRA